MMAEVDRFGRRVLGVLVHPLARVLVALRVPADGVTVAGFFANLWVAALIAQGRLQVAGVAVLLAGLFDALDGAVARMANRQNRSGALLDSVVDRYSEAVIFFGLLYYFFSRQHWIAISFTFLAIVGSQLVSYVRARAEGLNIECRVGLMQRAERIVLLAVGLWGSSWTPAGLSFPGLGSDPFLVFVLGVLAVLTNVTAIHRLIFSYAELQRAHRES